jgi:hypothetical protein
MNNSKLNLTSKNGAITLAKWTEYPDGWYGYPESVTWASKDASFYSKREWKTSAEIVEHNNRVMRNQDPEQIANDEAN